jgi:type III secretion protein V
MSSPFSKVLTNLGGKRILSLINESSDLILAFFIITIIAMLVVPFSPHLIDVLIGINLSLSIVLLFVALYIPKSTNLSVFPSLLLMTTLYRLGVNISSSRQILLHAYAGDIIQAFGSFVVGGNYVVGGIIFLIITIVQFIVVTKGAERVAEVAARFVLDGMPGKQMSIDADLRAGTIDNNKAKELRSQLQKESQLYGAMDGAMKFVKGDAIAGIVIAVINIVGGLIIGMFMHGMSAGEAARIYTVLSIGDGLVSQIPALLIAITAGLVTTRVSSDEKKESNLGEEISTQLLSQPKGIILASAFTFIAGLVPGFPFWVFFILTILLASFGFGFYFTKKRSRSTDGGGTITVAMDKDGKNITYTGSGEDLMLTLPVIMEAGSIISDLVRKDRGGENFIEEMVPKMRHALYQDLGVRFPGVHVRTDSQKLAADEYMILLNEVPVVRGKIVQGCLLTNEDETNLKRFNIPFTLQKNSLNLPALWVESRYQAILENAGIKFWTPLQVVVLHLTYFFKSYASEFIGIQEMRGLIEFMEGSYPDLIKEVTRLVPLQKLTEIFRRLVQEEISIKDLRTIFESLSEWAQTEKDTVMLTEYVRSSLKRYISYKYSMGQSIISVYVLDPSIEEMVRGAVKQTSAGSYLALDPDSSQLVMSAMRAVIKPQAPGGQPPVILTAIDVRRFVRKFIESEFPNVVVLSYQEIVPEIRMQPLGRIQLS